MQVAAVSMQMSPTADEEYVSCHIHQQTDISSHAVNTCDFCLTQQAVMPKYHVMSPMEVVVVLMQISHTADEEYVSCHIHQQTDISSHAVNTCDVCPTLQAVMPNYHVTLPMAGLENIVIFSKISKISDIFDFFDIFDIFIKHLHIHC